MWAPQSARAIYARLTRDGMKGSGDYGCISVGIYNGQGINRPKLNRTPSWFARVTYPIVLGEMVVEPGFRRLPAGIVHKRAPRCKQKAMLSATTATLQHLRSLLHLWACLPNIAGELRHVLSHRPMVVGAMCALVKSRVVL